jgi:hypothetical protein
MATRRRIIIAGCIVGWLLLFGALVALFFELFRWGRDGVYQAASVGEVWVAINANSLVGFGAVIEQRLSPWLWIEIIVPLLTLPAWLVLGLPGALLAWTCHRTKRRPMFHKP